MAPQRVAGRLRFDAAALAAATGLTVDVDDQVAELPRALLTVDQLPALHNSAADFGADRQHDDVAEAARSAKARLGDQSHAAIVIDGDGPSKGFGDDALQVMAGKIQVSTGQNFSAPTVDAARNADTDRDGACPIHFADEFLDERKRPRWIPAAWRDFLSEDLTGPGDARRSQVSPANVNADCESL